MAIERHRLASARFEASGGMDDQDLAASAFDRLAAVAQTSAGAAAVASYVANLGVLELPPRWLKRFAATAGKSTIRPTRAGQQPYGQPAPALD
jgi:hypothetical protein